MAETLSTELEAVNTILGVIGEAPVNTLSGAVTADVQIARNKLKEISRVVQSGDWHFNREYEVTLMKDVDGYINLPANTLKVDSNREDGSVDLVQRGTKLYDRKAHTYKFTRDQVVDITYFLSWDELPEQARRYITIRAARTFQAGNVGSETLNGFTAQEEVQALSDLKAADSENADYSIFDNYSTYRMLHRNRR